jgi:phosphomannomutase
LLIAELLSTKGQSLSSLVGDAIDKYPSSGEINSKIEDPKAAIERVKAKFAGDAQEIDYTDGLSMSYGTWRFNLRSSNTEPVVRLNVESKGDRQLMEEKTEEILSVLRA